MKTSEMFLETGKAKSLNALKSVLIIGKGQKSNEVQKELNDYLATCETKADAKAWAKDEKLKTFFEKNLPLAFRNFKAAFDAIKKIELQKVNEAKELTEQQIKEAGQTFKGTLEAIRVYQKDFKKNFEDACNVVTNKELFSSHPLEKLAKSKFNSFALIGQLNVNELIDYIENGAKFDAKVILKAMYKVNELEQRGQRFTPQVQTTEGAKFADFLAAVKKYGELCQPFLDAYNSDKAKEDRKNAAKLRQIDIENGVSQLLVESNNKTRLAKIYNNDKLKLDKIGCAAIVLNDLLPILRPSMNDAAKKKLLAYGVNATVIERLSGRDSLNLIDENSENKASTDAAKIEA
jgi:hypothetical protein